MLHTTTTAEYSASLPNLSMLILRDITEKQLIIIHRLLYQKIEKKMEYIFSLDMYTK